MAAKIVAIRHGKPLNQGYADDALRPLSEEGKEVQRKLSQRLKEMKIFPSLILTSPLLRAQQTAEITNEFFKVQVIDEPALGNDFDKDTLIERIRSQGDEVVVYLIGHAPTLGNFINALVGKAVLPEGLSKSCAAIVEFDGIPEFGNGRYINYIKPE